MDSLGDGHLRSVFVEGLLVLLGRRGLEIEDDILDRAGEGVRRLVLVGQVDDPAIVAADVHASVGREDQPTLAELRGFFSDEHVHMALLVHDSKLIGTVDRHDRASTLGGNAAASSIATLSGRTIPPDAIVPTDST